MIAVQKRVQTALIVESGEIREVMHAALLLGYGASAINPYMAFAVLDALVKQGEIQLNYETAEKNYIKAVCKGLYKVMSKMGISTIRSYRGAKIFEAIGLSQELLKEYFGTDTSSIGGIRLEEIAKDYIAFHDAGFFPEKWTICCLISVYSHIAKMGRNMHGILKQSVHYNWLPGWEAIPSSKSSHLRLTIRKHLFFTRFLPV